MTMRWWENHYNLLKLAEYLVEDEGYSAQQLLHVLEKPWHYEDEWLLACLGEYTEI